MIEDRPTAFGVAQDNRQAGILDEGAGVGAVGGTLFERHIGDGDRGQVDEEDLRKEVSIDREQIRTGPDDGHVLGDLHPVIAGRLRLHVDVDLSANEQVRIERNRVDVGRQVRKLNRFPQRQFARIEVTIDFIAEVIDL